MNKLKVGIIGLGHQAVEDHIPGINSSQYAELKAVCDIDKDKVEKWQKELKVKGYLDYHKLIDNEKLDFIIAATPHNVYGDIIKAAAEKKLHILKEKPFARNLKEAKEFKKLAENKGIEIMTTLQRRFNPIYTSFHQLADQIGVPFFVEVKYTLYVNNPHKGWRGARELAGGGCILDMAYHMIDLIIWYFGLPDMIYSRFSTKARPENTYDAEDTATVIFSYEKGLNGNMIISRYLPPKTEYMNVVGTNGIINLQRGKISRHKNNGEQIEKLERDKAWKTASTAQIDYFCKILRKEKKNIGGPQYHLQHASFIDACYLSQKQNKVINPKILLNQ